MNRSRCIVVLIACAGGIVAGCHQSRVQSPKRPVETLVALLPDPDDGVVGKAVVSNDAGSGDLATARAATRIVGSAGPGAVTTLSETDAQALFGDVISALPSRARHFTLYFEFESDGLTADSRALLPKILQTVKDFPCPEVEVIGHTDTTGAATANIDLGLKRANTVRKLLLDTGVDGKLVRATSHGERDLLVQTPDEIFEPRNRRVEISIR